MSWASDAIGAIRKIVLLEDRVERLAGQVDSLAEVCKDMDRRLVRLEAKFELLERAALSRPRQLRDKAE
ncbi:MAG TPA: hypothetical protein VEU98_03455 [Candidatus Eremiobacteraceae bacterium]|jgi:hypothetical protein|nr:hypothetical protein [Candidatus Eremiobacteraceae bacterium]